MPKLHQNNNIFIRIEPHQDKLKLYSSLAMLFILLLSFGLRLWRADTFGIGNVYYTAAADNMLLSPSNFFFAVADAGGVTAAKPPIALWLQSLAFGFFGPSGFSVALVSIFAGSLSASLLYRTISREFNPQAGILAAFILTITPISLAVDRTNVADSVLIFTMLLAAWGMLWAIRKSTTFHVMLALGLLGIAFNAKMLQSFLMAPALYAVYFLGAESRWQQKIKQLIAGTLVLFFVSFLWIGIVELIPVEHRPYIGDTSNNSMIELTFGYNGLMRILGGTSFNALTTGNNVISSVGQASPEIGIASPFRFFQKELGNELSWLLPFAFWAIIILLMKTRVQIPLSKEHRAIVLWGGWLVVGMIILSSLQFLHAFYLATIVPPLAALVAIGCVQLWELAHKSRLLGLGMAYVALLSTLAFQLFLMSYYLVPPRSLLFALSCLFVILLIATSRSWDKAQTQWKVIANLAYLSTLLLIPLFWGFATAAERPDMIAPQAYEARENRVFLTDMAISFAEGDLNILDVVQRDDTVKYDLVVSIQSMAADLTILTDLRVLYLGGFSGTDPIYTVESFVKLVEAGDIGYVLNSGLHPDIMGYVAGQCLEVRRLIEPSINPQTGKALGGAILYDC